jgi:hypothetical protein
MNIEKEKPKMKKLAALLALFGSAALAQGLSKNCVDELIAAQAKSKDAASFSKDLVAEVVKTKAQLKLPFGKPKDSKVTGIGMTVGCLKNFPETPEGVASTLASAGLSAATGAAAGALGGAGAAGLQAANLQPKAAVFPPPLPAALPLKQCSGIFNTANKFCYDGTVYDKCDGIEYNPKTHTCEGGVAHATQCSEGQYNPETHGCGENNAVFAKCGTVLYNPATHGCGEDNAVYPKCGGTIYSPEAYGCENNAVLPKCGETLYNISTHGCSEDKAVLPKCGEHLYDAAVQKCENNAVVALQAAAPAALPAAEQCKDEESKEAPKKTRFGFRANIGGNMGDGFSFPNFGGGITLLVPLSSIYLVQEISFAHRSVDIGADITETAIEVPLIFRFRHNKDNLVFLGIGPLFGFVLSSEASSSGGNKYYFSRPAFDVGIATELGFRIGDHFTIDLRALHSFADYEYYEYSYNSYGYYERNNDSELFYLLKFQLGISLLF